MATIKQRFTDFLLGEEKRKLQETTRILYEAYQAGKYEVSPTSLASQLQEVSPWTIEDLLLQVQYEAIGSSDQYGVSVQDERKYALNESQRLYKHDPMAQWQIWLWTFFGFGEDIQVMPEDENAAEVWSEFWEADRNVYLLSPDKLQYLSQKVLVDGEFFFVYYVNTLRGSTTVRLFNSSQISQIITTPGDDMEPLYYKRQWVDGDMHQNEMYYPDWLTFISYNGNMPEVDLPKGARLAHLEKPETIVLCQHVAHNIKSGNRGWPLLSTAAPWIRAHKRFREDRSAVAASVAMFVNQIKAKGAGSRGVDAIKQVLNSQLSQSKYNDTNPPSVAGSTFIANDASELSRMPLNTGGGDAKSDGEALLLMAGIGGGLYPHWMGAGDSYRLATATSMEGPMLRQFSMYQKFWSAQFRDMVRVVLSMSEKYGGGKIFESYEAEISTDRLIETDLQQVSQSISALYRDFIIPMMENGLLTSESTRLTNQAVLRIVLQALGVNDANEITSDEIMQIDNEGNSTAPEQTDVTEGIASLIKVLQVSNSEFVDDNGKLVPRGEPLRKFEKADRDITIEDISAAVKAWDNDMPQEVYGLLGATKSPEGK